jgi:putative transcriptional regulator
MAHELSFRAGRADDYGDSPERTRQEIDMTTTAVRRTRLAETRKARGLSQAKLAKRLNIATSTIARLELGEIDPALSTAFKIARSLDRTVDWLFVDDAEAGR